jgi:5-formyltetrahydrofolate cyclo-ligase
MNMGIGIPEIIVIALLALVLFGPDELPRTIRKAAGLLAQIRLYSNKLKKEMDDAIQTENTPHSGFEGQSDIKKTLRWQYRNIIRNQSDENRWKKSEAIWSHLTQLPEYIGSTAIMIYINTDVEVITRKYIDIMINSGKRVIVPYCKNNVNEMGIAEIKDVENDLTKGLFGISEPREEIRNNFFKSDLQLIICPGLAFDKYGSRLGRGKGYYDVFLTELKGRIPITGLAYTCQIYEKNLPTDYHDVKMDKIITENGLVFS